MKCATRMCPRSARIVKYCPDCALPDHADLAADGVYRLYTGRFATVLSGVLVTQGPIDGAWPSYAAATEFLADCKAQAAIKPKIARKRPTPRFDIAAQVHTLGADSLLPPKKPARKRAPKQMAN
jgi:hypothetical protein